MTLLTATRRPAVLTALAAVPLTLVPAALLTASPAAADVERADACGRGFLELNVDRERGGWEVDADLDAARGSRWTVTLSQNGSTYYRQTRTADREGEIDVDTLRRDTAGSDTFRATAAPVGGGASCSVVIRVR